VTFGLGIRDSCLVILFFNLISAVPPAYLWVLLADSLAENVLNQSEKVLHGARNSVCVSCAHHDIHLGEYSACHRCTPTGYGDYVDIMVPWFQAYSQLLFAWVSASWIA
jgi:hypothetical protein